MVHYITSQKCNICKATGTGTLLKDKTFTRFICKMCDSGLYQKIANKQKDNWLQTGSIRGGR